MTISQLDEKINDVKVKLESTKNLPKMMLQKIKKILTTQSNLEEDFRESSDSSDH